MSSSRSSASSAVTRMPGRQWMALVERRPPPWTATTLRAARLDEIGDAVGIEGEGIGGIGHAALLMQIY